MHLDKILTKEFLWQKLIQEKYTMTKLMKEVGCSKHAIIDYCRLHNVYEEVLTSRRPKIKNLKGKKIGKWTVLEMCDNDCHGKVRWLCRCECGEENKVNASSLIKNISNSCGKCSAPNFKGYKCVSGTYMKVTKKGAGKRGLDFEITAEDVYNKWVEQNGKCALSGVDVFFTRNQETYIQTASIDRIDSKRGYTLDNIQIVHKRLNMIKSSLPEDEFVYWCHLVAKNRKITENFDTSKISANLVVREVIQ